MQESSEQNTRLKRAGIIRLIYILCMAGAALNHLNDVISGGILPYTYAPLALNIYWTSLTVIDPLVIILLIFKLWTGIYAVAAVIFTNVPINAFAEHVIFKTGMFTHWQTQSQLAFGIFVLLTIKPALYRESQKNFISSRSGY